MAGPDTVRAAMRDMKIVDAELDRLTTPLLSGSAPVPVQQSIPRWKSSLGEIQNTASSLMTENAQLTAENQLLMTQVKGLEAGLAEARGQGEAIVRQAMGQDRNIVDELARLRQQVEAGDGEVVAQKGALLVLKTRLGEAKRRSSLAQLRASDLELEKKAHELDGHARSNTVLSGMRTEIGQLKSRIVLIQDQTRQLLQNAAELGKVERPYWLRIREIMALTTSAKERLEALKSEKERYSVKLNDLKALQARPGRYRNARRIQQLQAERTVLETRFKDYTARLEALQSNTPDNTKGYDPAGIVTQLEGKNKNVEMEIGDLRENIALLEYKVNSLQRYKDRNKPARQPK